MIHFLIQHIRNLYLTKVLVQTSTLRLLGLHFPLILCCFHYLSLYIVRLTLDFCDFLQLSCSLNMLNQHWLANAIICFDSRLTIVKTHNFHCRFVVSCKITNNYQIFSIFFSPPKQTSVCSSSKKTLPGLLYH